MLKKRTMPNNRLKQASDMTVRIGTACMQSDHRAIINQPLAEVILMKPEWKSFLQNAGAEWDGDADRAISFGNPERERRMCTTGDVICDLSHFGLIAAYGEEAGQFLQSLLTNDLTWVSEYHSQLNAYCSAKGRMQAAFRIFMRKETYYLRLPQTMVEPLLERIQKFILRSKVTLENANEALVRIGFAGNQAPEILTEAIGTAPEVVDQCSDAGDYTVLRVPGTRPRFEIYGELEPMKKLWEKLNVHAGTVGADCWGLQDTLAGVPSVYPQTADAFVPQMANLDCLDGVSFNKGCYPGQEVIARTRYLGKLKRRMFLARCPGDQPPAPGTTVVDVRTPEEPNAGQVVDAYRHPDGDIALLAVLKIASSESGELHLGNNDGPLLTLQPLPYAFVDQAA